MSFWPFTKKNYTNLNRYSNENVTEAHKMPESHKSVAALDAAFNRYQNGQKLLRLRATKRQERNLLRQRAPASEHSRIRNWMPAPTIRTGQPPQSHVRNWMPAPTMKGARRTRKYIYKRE